MEKHQQKLNRKLQGELNQKIGDITFYLTVSLKDFNKARKWKEKTGKRKAHFPDEQQHKYRQRFQQQAEVETATRHNESLEMTTTDKATRLAKEQKATRIRGKEFEKW